MPRLALTACLALLGWAAACGADGSGGPEEPDLYCAQFQTRGDCANEAPPSGGSLTCQWMETRVYTDNACPGVVGGECLPIQQVGFGCAGTCEASNVEVWWRTDDLETTVAWMPTCGPIIQSEAWSPCEFDQGYPCDCACDEFEDDAP